MEPEKKEKQGEGKKNKKSMMLAKLLKKKREKDADVELSELLHLKEAEELVQGINHNKFGGFCLKANNVEKAETHLLKAKEIITQVFKIPATNIEMNIGNLFGQKRDYKQSIVHYLNVINKSPYGQIDNIHLPENWPFDKNKYSHIIYSSRLNSEEAYIDAHTNVAVMYIQVGQYELAHSFCKKALELQPNNFESVINFTDILRQLGKKEQAIKQTWDQLIEHTQQQYPDYKGFKAIEIKPWKPLKKISILSVKWGTRYPASYVNKLYAGIKRNTTWDIQFYCFTDDFKGLHPDIKVKELEEGWKKWWGKVTLFRDYGIKGRKFYIDLDMIITGNLDDLFSYSGDFGILRTGDLQCEKNHKEGYNSSVMIWNDDILEPVYGALKQNFQNINKFIVRFDFWLEMTINNADFLQELYPGQIVDFLADASQKLPQNSRVVCFARKPKPEDYPAEWVKDYWID